MPKSIRRRPAHALPTVFSTSFARLLLTLALITLGGGSLSACADQESEASSSASANAAPAKKVGASTNASEAGQGGHSHAEALGIQRASNAKAAKGEKAARNPNERPIPNFSGRTLAGTQLKIRDQLGTRLVLFFFNPEVDTAAVVARATNETNTHAQANNFNVIGIGIGSSTSKLRDFAKNENLSFPVIDDSSGEISRQVGLRSPVALLGGDAEGYMTFAVGAFPAEGDIEGFARDRLFKELRIASSEDQAGGELYAYPEAPELGVIAMSNGDKLETASLKGRAAIVIFFLHTCPHCHRALEAIKGILDGLPENQQPRLVAISVQNAPSAIRKSLSDLGLDFFDPYLDTSGDAAENWGVTGGVPVVTVVDPQGRIRHRSEGWDDKRDGGMLRMQAMRAAGARVPMLLDPKGYSGNDACGVCHEQEYATWQYTKHSTAFDTLVTHEADRRKDCIGCHVVGYEEPGGYNFTRRPAHLEDVGCESCHGRGGPHLSPTFVPIADASNTNGVPAGHKDYAQVCSTCHNPTHSLGFEFETFHPRVSHAGIAGMTNEQRSELAGGGGPTRNLLPTKADYVGSNACQSCHTKEFQTWSASAHGHAVATLEKQGKAGDADCLACHTTAYGRPGGFPEGVPVTEHPDLARVGCESCHGPGGDHIGESAQRVGTILSLGDKCDSCVILKVCGTCHDDANDPGFQFEVEQRIDDQRHGTIESAATKAGESAFRTHDPNAAAESATLVEARDRTMLRHAFKHHADHDGERS